MAKTTVKLAQALLRRKELTEKVKVLTQIKNSQVFNEHIERIKVDQGLDEIRAKFPKLTASQVIEEFDWHARQLRLVDAAIQHINWTADVELDASVMEDFSTRSSRLVPTV